MNQQTFTDNATQTNTERTTPTIRPRATLSYLENALGYSLTPVCRGIKAILKSERGTASPLGHEPSILDIYAFTLAAAPQILEEASTQLLSVVKRYHSGRSSFTVIDHRHKSVRIVVISNVIEEVHPSPKRNALKHRG